MSLTATQPDQELLDALSLDAAWEHAKQLEQEAVNLHAALGNARQRYDQLAKRWSDLRYGIMGILATAKPDTPEMAAVLDELNRLWTEI